MTLDGRINRLEREWDDPANRGPDPETVAKYALLWIEAGLEESRAMAAALEFLEYCQATGQDRSMATMGKWAREKGGEDENGPGDPSPNTPNRGPAT